MRSPTSIVIRDLIVPGAHDNLLEVLSQFPRKTGNMMVLSMSEACIEMWPPTIADYQTPESPQSQAIKITVSPDKYPKLHALYESLPHGMKGAIFVNLLNRHQLLKESQPEKVNQALLQMLKSTSAALAVSHSEASVEETIGTAGAVASASKVGAETTLDAETADHSRAFSGAAAAMIEDKIEEGFFDPEQDDPFATLPLMDFS